MSFSIQTNITSLQAQNNLATSAAFQAKTIGKVTSGLRIVNSGDDAAGLAIANSLRSDQAVLTQGIQNANNGLATLQTIDGGINNISTLLNRASTLAAQAATGTFTGDRNVLNSEFQSVVAEVSRQAQSIGLNNGGQFAQALSVFVGGGQAGKGATSIANGSINVDLSKSAVDAASLGLQGTTATGATGSDIGNGGATTVSNIIANTANNAGAGTSFNFSGAGFSDAGKVNLKVDLSTVTDTASLASAINSAIKLATTNSAGVTTGTAFANAGITASISTDTAGKQQLTFSSGTAAFQVGAGDQTANAFLGNFNPTAVVNGVTNASTGQSLTSTTAGQGAASKQVGVATATTTTATVLTISGGNLTSPLVINLAAGTVAVSLAALTDVSSANTTNRSDAEALAAAGITVSGGSAGAAITLTGPGKFTAVSTGDVGLGFASGGVTQTLGLGSANNVALRVQGSGTATPIDFALTAGNTVAQDLTQLQDITTTSGAALKAAGITVALNATTQQLTFTSLTGGSVNVLTSGDATNALGFGSFGPVGGTTTFDATSATGTAPTSGATNPAGQTLQISVAGGTGINVTIAAQTTAQNATAALSGSNAASSLNSSIQGNAALKSAGLVATANSSGLITITSTNGTAFRVNATALDDTGAAGTVATDFGFGTGLLASTGSVSNTLVTNSKVDSAGASSSGPYVFNATSDQTVKFTANDATGTGHTTSINLQNSTTIGSTHNAQTIDQAIASINAQLQGSGDTTLNQIVAVKDVVAGGTAGNPVDTEGIKFISSLSSFNVTLGASGTATSSQGIGTATNQKATAVSSTGSNADISTVAGAAAAVSLLASAVSKLGVAQAAIGKGENNLNYAVALATSQDTNEAAAESNIRDANLAVEAANLSKAQILVQAGTAALAQANSAPQAILSLLK